MHEKLFASAVLPEKPVVLKLPLLPYSLGHELFLFRRNNPILLLDDTELLSLPVDVRIQSIIDAVDICSQQWAELHRSPSNWRERFKLKRIWAKWERALKCEQNDLNYYTNQIASFRAYIAVGKQDFPGHIPDDAEGESSYVGAPESLRLYQFLCAHVPAAELATYGTSAWDFPYGLARMQFSAHLESDGRWSIYNWKDQCHDNYVAEREAQRKAEGKEVGVQFHPPAEAVPTDKPEVKS